MLLLPLKRELLPSQQNLEGVFCQSDGGCEGSCDCRVVGLHINSDISGDANATKLWRKASATAVAKTWEITLKGIYYCGYKVRAFVERSCQNERGFETNAFLY